MPQGMSQCASAVPTGSSRSAILEIVRNMSFLLEKALLNVQFWRKIQAATSRAKVSAVDMPDKSNT